MNDRIALGVGTNALASTGGSTTQTMTVNNMPAHSHGVGDPGHTHIDAGHSHNYLAITSRVFNGIGGASQWLANPETTQATDPAAVTLSANTTGITISNAGGGQPFSIINPFLCLFYIIKT